MVLESVHCPDCDGIQVIKHGKTSEGKQRYRCQDPHCKRNYETTVIPASILARHQQSKKKCRTLSDYENIVEKLTAKSSL